MRFDWCNMTLWAALDDFPEAVCPRDFSRAKGRAAEWSGFPGSTLIEDEQVAGPQRRRHRFGDEAGERDRRLAGSARQW